MDPFENIQQPNRVSERELEDQSQSKLKTFSECMQSVGLENTYQKNMLLSFAPFWIIASFFVFQQLYTFQEPDYICPAEPHLTQQECENYVCYSPLHIFNPDTDVQPANTFTYHFGLFCGKQPQRLVYKVLPELLAIPGYLVFGMVGDYKGRLVAMKITWRFFILGLLFYSLSQTQFLITFGYTLAAFNCLPTLLLQLTILFEESNNNFRSVGSLVILTSLGLGQFILSLVAKPVINSLGSSFLILIFLAIPAFICNFFIGFIIESPRFVYSRNKVKGLNLLNRIAARNNYQRVVIDLAKSYWLEDFRKFNSLTYIRGFYFPTLRRRMLTGFFSLVAIRFATVSAQILLDDQTSPYIRGSLMSVTTTLADVALCFFIRKIGRTVYRQIFLLALASLLLLIVFYSTHGEFMLIPNLVFSICLRFIGALAYGIMVIWGVEAFPTLFRVMGYSFVMCGASLGAVLPYIFKQHLEVLMWLIFSISLLVIPVSRKMPDTLLHPMKDEIDGVKFYAEDKFYKY